MMEAIRKFLQRISSPWALFCALALGVTIAQPPGVQGETLYYPGDVVTVRASALDSLGRAFLPASARGIVYTSAGIIDSSQTYPGGGLTQPIPAVAELKWTFTIPAGTAVVDYMFATIFTGDGFTRDLAVTEPGRARVNAFVDSVGVVAVAETLDEAFPPSPTFIDSVRAVSLTYNLVEEITATVAAVDSITPDAAIDLLVATAGENIAVVDSTDCTPCGVYLLGNGVDGAQVFLTRESVFSAAADVEGYEERTVDGFWRAQVPTTPGVPDTFYVWAYYNGTYQVEGVQLVVP